MQLVSIIVSTPSPDVSVSPLGLALEQSWASEQAPWSWMVSDPARGTCAEVWAVSIDRLV